MTTTPDIFPTPPSSASTPPATTTNVLPDVPPPRKRARLNPPANPAITTPEEPVDDVLTALAIKVPRIRIKWAAQSPRRTSTRLTGRQSGGEMEESEMNEE